MIGYFFNILKGPKKGAEWRLHPEADGRTGEMLNDAVAAWKMKDF